MIEIFSDNSFMSNALISGILAAISCAIVGTWIILRGLSFIGDALAHGVLPGVAGAILLGFPGMIGAAVGGLVMVGGINLIQKKTRLTSDTAIGLLFAGMLSLGVIIVSKSPSASGDLVRILFGDLLGADLTGILIQLTTLIVLVILAFLLHRPFLLLCFSTEYTKVSGFNPKLFHTIMLVLIGGIVIASFQTVGTMLVFGLLLGPAATAALWVHRIHLIMIVAAIIGSLSVFFGLIISYFTGFPAGPSVVLFSICLFFLSLIIHNIKKAKQ